MNAQTPTRQVRRTLRRWVTGACQIARTGRWIRLSQSCRQGGGDTLVSASPLRFTHQLHLNTCLVATAFAVKSLSPVTSIKCQLQPSKPHFKPSFRVTFPPVSPPTCISTYASPPWYNLVSTLCPP